MEAEEAMDKHLPRPDGKYKEETSIGFVSEVSQDKIPINGNSSSKLLLSILGHMDNIVPPSNKE